MVFNCIQYLLCGLIRGDNGQVNSPVATPASEEYKYTDLRRADSVIRLLEISSSGFTLQTYDLDDAPSYWALSYTWGQAEESIGGSQNDKFRLNLDATHLYIFGNLYQGLMEIQRRLVTIQGRIHIWADAVCINQGNVDEVNSQVNIMDQIYSRAAAVLVWLGSDARGEMPVVEDILAKFERLHLRIVEIATREATKPGDVVRRDMFNLLSAVNLPPVDNDRWQALLAFFRRLWFRRLWIVQEVALAQEIMVWCGNETLSWAAIERCAEILNSGLEKAILFSDRSRTDTFVIFYSRHAGLITHIRRWFTDGNLPDNFTDVYQLVTGREHFDKSFAYFLLGYLSASIATDPRDKIFGCLGMLRKLTPGKPSFIEADYRLDDIQVYTEATKKMLSDLNWLGLLSLVTTAEGPLRSRLPSWVPDFTPTSVHNFSVEGDPNFNATGKFRVNHATEEQHRLAFDGTKLQLSGRRVAVVRSKSERLQEFYNHKINFENGNKLILELEGDGTYLPSGESFIDAFWKTMIANGRSGMPEAEGRASFLSFWLFNFLFLAVLEWKSKKIPVEEYVKTMPNLEVLATQNESSSLPGHAAVINAFREMEQDRSGVDTLTQEAQLYSLRAGDWVPSRVLFSTREGYLGIGHESLQDSDEIWVTPNGPVPLILRPIQTVESPDRFVLVGECYVHGIMYGEVFYDEEPLWQRIWLV